MSSFGIYVFGTVVLVGGLLLGLFLLGVPLEWIAVVGVIGIGLGMLTGVSRTRRPDPSQV